MTSECPEERRIAEECEPCEYCGTPVRLSSRMWLHLIRIDHNEDHEYREGGGGIRLGCGSYWMPHLPEYCRAFRSFNADSNRDEYTPHLKGPTP